MDKFYNLCRLLGATVLLMGCVLLVHAQNLENADLKHPVKLNGSVAFSAGYYDAAGIANRQDPFQYNISGTLNVDIANLMIIPISANFSQQQQDILQPFNQFGMSPVYKNLTVHLGYRNMMFSEYSLAGHTFLGAGAEYTTPRLRLAAMHGRLRKAIEGTERNNFNGGIAYRRTGYGVKVGFGDPGNYLDLIFFHAHDDASSLTDSTSRANVLPEENLVLALAGKKQITKQMSIQGEYSGSAYSTNTLLEETGSAAVPGIFKVMGGLFTPRASSSFQKALKFTVLYAGKGYSLNATYNRIDPDYRTMGAFYFQNDLENITAGGNASLLKDKVSLSVNAGMQRNNLSGDKEAQTSRYIGSVSLSYRPRQELNFTGSYSNFSNALQVRRNILSDSLEFFQVTQNASLGSTYTFVNDKRHSISVNLAFQNAFTRKAYEIDPQGKTVFQTIGVSHSLNLPDRKVRFTTSGNYSRIRTGSTLNENYGPVFSILKNILPDLTVTVVESFQVTQSGEGSQGMVNNIRLGSNYRFARLHTAGVMLSHLGREQKMMETNKSFSEFKAQVTYVLTF